MFLGIEKIDSSVFSQKHLAIPEIFISNMPQHTSSGLLYKIPQIPLTQLLAAGEWSKWELVSASETNMVFIYEPGKVSEMFANAHWYQETRKINRRFLQRHGFQAFLRVIQSNAFYIMTQLCVYVYVCMSVHAHTHTHRVQLRHSLITWVMHYSSLVYPIPSHSASVQIMLVVTY